MTQRLLPIVGLMTVLAAGPATAADVSALRTMPVVSSSYNWTGCYVGINAGGIGYRNNLVSGWADGGMFGGQGGCNYQIDHIVVGLELEGMWSGASATLTTAAPMLLRLINIGNGPACTAPRPAPRYRSTASGSCA
jgi:outer membrane immunogenic protein